MKQSRPFLMALTSVLVAAAPFSRAGEPTELEAMIYVLNEEIFALRQKIADLEAKAAAADKAAAAPSETAQPVFRAPSSIAMGEGITVGGQGAVLYADTETDGAFPNNEFRVDEAQIDVDARLAESVFFHTEVLITQRESQDEDLHVGELYLDIEDLSRSVDREFPLTLRLGRFDTPFGEEYESRDAIRNPLISHSLSDIRGIDEGLELFGSIGLVDYTFAVQNGGYESLRDGDPDKALVGRVGVRPVDRLRLSASAMRTGEIDVEKDEFAELWFGNLQLGPLGEPGSAEEFWADLYQADVSWTWDGGRVAAFAGRIEQDDDGSAGAEADASFYSVEGVQDVGRKFYAASRYSVIRSDDGFPVLGQGRYDESSAAPLVDDIWRLSLGLGYRWSENLVLKTEYSFERGETTDGRDLDKQDQFAAQAAFGF